MTILFLSRLFYPHLGGVERHVMEVGKRLARKHKVIVVTERIEGSKKEEEINGIRVYRISVGSGDWFKKVRVWRELWKLRQVIASSDIVHCHDVFFWYLPFRFLFLKKPVYTTFHGYENYPISQKAIFVRKLSEKLSWGNICIGEFIKKWYGTKPTYVSYGAVDLRRPHLNPLLKREGMKPIKKESAVFIGRLDEQTGIKTYAKAVTLIRKALPGFAFLIVGDGEYKSEVSKVGKTIGFQEEPEKYFQHYRFAFVSRYLSILEALAAKRLVFAVYDNPVKEDYLKMADFATYIITAANAEELYEKVLYFTKHQLEEQILIEKGYEWAKNQTWEKLMLLYLKLWKTV